MVRESGCSRLRCPHGWVAEREERKEGGGEKEKELGKGGRNRVDLIREGEKRREGKERNWGRMN